MNTSPPPQNDKEYYTAQFVDAHGNRVVFLYQDCICATPYEAGMIAVKNALQIILLGLKFDGFLTIPEDAKLPHVECTVEDPFVHTKYRMAILSGPEFDKHYDHAKAEETDIKEDRARKAKAQAQQLDERLYEHEVKMVNDAMSQANKHLN